MTTKAEVEVTSPQHSGRYESHPAIRCLIDRLTVYGATATAMIFIAGLVVSLVGICLVGHPYLGWSDNVALDAKAVATGHLQYGNPATEFVGQPYAPLFTFLFAALLKVYWWEGWGPIISILSVAGALVSLVWMLWGTARRLGDRLASASVVVVLSLGGISALQFDGFFEGRPDQMAWCLFVAAGAITFRGLVSLTGLSRRQMVFAGLLLTSSVFTKQTTLVPCLLVSVLTVMVATPEESRRTWTWRKWLNSATALVTFAGSSALFGLVLQLMSHGYAFDNMVLGPLRYRQIVPPGKEVGPSLRLLAVPLAALVVLAFCVAWSLLASREQRQRRHTTVAVAAVVVALSPIPTALLAEAKLGGANNQLVGPVWTLTLGCAVLALLLRPSARQLAAGAIACGVLLIGIVPLPTVAVAHRSGPLTFREESQITVDHIIGIPELRQHASWSSVDPFLMAAVDKGEVVFDPNNPSLSVSPKAPDYPAQDVNDIFAAGYTPRPFIRNLLEGRYALVLPYDLKNLSWFYEPYVSDVGRYDESVIWKLNLLLRMGYQPVKDPDSGEIYMRPAPQLKNLGWFAGCFGPYQAQGAGVQARVRGSGGLVCVDHGDLHLSQAPGPSTQIVMTLRQGKGEVSVRFATTPHTLRVTPLNSDDRTSSPGPGIDRANSPVGKCLVHDGAGTVLTLKAARRGNRVGCRMSGGESILDVPETTEGSTVHVLITVSAVDSPTLVATSKSGRAAPFTLLNLTPSSVNSL